MRISIFGLGYVGAVSAACLARDEHFVIGVDKSATKVEMLDGGHSPIIEPGLDTLIAGASDSGRLRATIDGFDALSAHVLVGRGEDCHGLRRQIERVLEARFEITHTTLQVDHDASDALIELRPAAPRRR